MKTLFCQFCDSANIDLYMGSYGEDWYVCKSCFKRFDKPIIRDV